TLKSALQKALEFERIAIGLYNDLVNNTQGKDNVTYHLALDILEDEAKDEQELEDILNKLEF
ncbi:MAG: ferritin-like domain-containing protein, partial [Nitrosopumilaceae archaeon]